MRSIVVIALALVAGRAVYADPASSGARPAGQRRAVAILDVRVGEGVPVAVAEQFQHDLDQMVDPQHYFLVPRSKVHDLMANSTKWTDGCVIGPCIREVKAQSKADVALIAALTGSGTSFGSVITLVRTDTGHVLAQESARCDVCTLDEALATAEHASVKLLDALPRQLPDETAPAREAADAAAHAISTRVDQIEHRHVAAGYALSIVGVLAAGAGIALYEAEGHDTYALASAGAGIGLFLGGVTVLAF